MKENTYPEDIKMEDQKETDQAELVHCLLKRFSSLELCPRTCFLLVSWGNMAFSTVFWVSLASLSEINFSNSLEANGAISFPHC